MIQSTAAMVIKDAIRGMSKEKIPGTKICQQKRWYRKLYCIFKSLRNQSQYYLFKMLTTESRSYRLRNSESLPTFKVKHNLFKKTFFWLSVIKLNNLD